VPAPDEQGRAVRGSSGDRSEELSALVRELLRSPAEPASSWDGALVPGASIGRFELVRELGRGGFGVVWEARDLELGRHVALKAVRARGPRGDPEERLLAEAEAAARLAHPNIVTLHDVGRSEHGPYLVLELLQGRTLAERLRVGPLPPGEAVRVATDVARALAHAHAHGVVHRDLKPANVFLCADGPVKVLDLGLAHALGLRRTGGGTPAYMAPEQLEGSPEDERTDVFALGAILFEMLAGKLPFPRGGRARSRRRRVPRLEVPGAPALGALVARMLDGAPLRRPRDGGEVLSALSAMAAELERAPQPGIPVRAKLPPGRSVRVAAAVAAVAAAAIGGVALWSARGPEPARGRAAPSLAAVPGAPGPRVAVLPFVDLSPGKDQEYLADGVAEEILNALTQVRGLRVIGRTSSFSFKGKNEDLRTIGKRLGVSTILEGSVRTQGDRVRIAADLVDVGGGDRLWSKTFDRERTGLFAVQDEIARAVVEALEVKLLPGEALTTAAVSTQSPEAHTQWLIARHLLRSGSIDESRRAIPVLKRAVALDPAYAPAWAQLGTAFGNLALWTRSKEAEPLWQEARRAADKAVEAGPNLGYAYAVRGWLSGMRWDWPAARADLERALAMNPGDPEILNAHAIMLEREGRFSEGVAEARRAVDLDPLMGVAWSNLGAYLTERRDYPGARAAFERAMEVSPQSTYAAYELATLDLVDGRPAEALARFEQERESALRLSGVAIAQFALGRRHESDEALRQLVARAGDDAPYNVAVAHAWRGERDAAFEWLDRAYARHDIGLRNVKADVLLWPLREDPRFRDLLRKMRLPAE